MLRVYLKMYLKSMYQYKGSFYMMCISQIVSPIFAYYSIMFLFDKFGRINGYSLEQVLVCFAVVWCEYSIAMFLGSGFEDFPSLISNGQFDRMLLRPMNIVLQIIISKLEISKVSNIFVAFIILGNSLKNIEFNILKILSVLLMIVCGSILFLCIVILYAAFCVFAIDGFGVYKIFTDGAKELTQYPINIYKKVVVTFFTFVIPFALVNYYPYLYVIGKTTKIYYSFLPLLTIFFVLPTFYVWKKSMIHFKSVGS